MLIYLGGLDIDLSFAGVLIAIDEKSKPLTTVFNRLQNVFGYSEVLCMLVL